MERHKNPLQTCSSIAWKNNSSLKLWEFLLWEEEEEWCIVYRSRRKRKNYLLKIWPNRKIFSITPNNEAYRLDRNIHWYWYIFLVFFLMIWYTGYFVTLNVQPFLNVCLFPFIYLKCLCPFIGTPWTLYNVIFLIL